MDTAFRQWQRARVREPHGAAHLRWWHTGLTQVELCGHIRVYDNDGGSLLCSCIKRMIECMMIMIECTMIMIECIIIMMVVLYTRARQRW
jgi:hypothetical protein